MKATIALLPGDGIGPEVIGQAQATLAHIADLFDHEFTFDTYPVGGAALDELDVPLPAATLAACKAADAVLLGAVGGPRWDDPSASARPEQALLQLRRELDVFANLRPVRADPQLADISPLKPSRLEGVDILIVRELTGGLYFGDPRGRERVGGELRATDTLTYTEAEIRRIVELAFAMAADRRGHLTSVDKANVLESSRLWREVVESVGAGCPEVAYEHMLVDAAAMRLMTDPAHFDVLVTENLFGDILSDEASVLTGSLGMLPSASLGADGPGLYEPVHGSAPDIAGQGIANPVGALLSAAMLLRHSLQLPTEASHLEAAVAEALAEGIRTPDLRGNHTTAEVGLAVQRQLTTLVGRDSVPG